MKKTLTILALTAALLPLSPLTARGDTTAYWVKGIVWNDETQTAEGWFDAEKDRGANGWNDSNLCWAAACSNLVAWWQNQQEYEIEAPANLDEIWNQYRQTWANVGGHANLGLYWWLDGSYSKNGKTIPVLDNGLSPDLGGYYSDYLSSSPGFSQKVLDADLKVLEIDGYANARTLSESLVSYIGNGYGVELTWALGSSSSGHSVTIWGVEYDETQSVITHFYLTDSDHNANTLTKAPVEITTIESDGHLYETLARRDEYGKLYYKAWSFTVLNSRLGNDVHYFNYMDEDSHSIIMKQDAEGFNCTLKDDQKDVQAIVYDGSRGNQTRTLTVTGDNSVQTIKVDALQGTNFAAVQEGVTLTAGEVIGSGTLTKSGKGTLQVSTDSATAINIKEGMVHFVGQAADTGARITVDGGTLLCENGTLGEITLNSGGTLHGGGKYKNVTVNGGTLAVGNSPGQQRITGSLTLTHANLEFYVAGWEKAASLDESSWDSATYSNIDMGYGNKFSMNTADGIDSINIYVGGDALAALSTTGTFSLNLISDINSFDFYDSYLASMQGKTQFFVSDEAEALANTTWQAGQELTDYIDFWYEFENKSTWYSPSNIKLVGSFKGVAAPDVPEPATSTLSLLALAGLCARRRRK